MKNQLTQIENALIHFNDTNNAVSKRGVDWHLDHVLRIIVGVNSQLKQSNPSEFKSSFNFKRLVVLTTGKIPRGKAKAPTHVNTLTEINKNEVLSFLEKAKEQSIEFNNLNKNAHFNHPYFGLLNKKETKRFLEVHNNHHLKIIKDIIG